MFGGNALAREHKKTIAAINGNGFRQPRHEPADFVAMRDNDMVKTSHRTVFMDFGGFAYFTNHNLQHTPWTVEDKPEFRVWLPFNNVSFGRHYALFFRDLEAGSMRIYASDATDAEEPFQARCDVSLDFAQLLPHSYLHWLLKFLTAMMKDGSEYGTVAAEGEVTSAMTAHLWEVVRSPEVMLGFDMSIVGNYRNYVQRARDWSNGRSDDIFRV